MNTKNWKTIYLLSFCLFLTASCTSEIDLPSGKADDITLNCTRSVIWNDSRAITDNNGSGNFIDGDIIDMSVLAGGVTKVMYPEFLDGNWVPSLKRSDYSGDFIVSAIYPILPRHAGSNDEVRDIELPLMQNSLDNYNSADVLYAKTHVTVKDTSAMLYFRHALHRINIYLKGTLPSDLQIEVRSRVRGHISVENGDVTVPEDVGYEWIKPLKQDDGSYSVIVLPQDSSPYHVGDGFIRFISDGKSSTYNLDSNIDTFSSGTQTTLNLTLKSGGIESVDTDFSNRICWVYGVTPNDFPGKKNIPSMPSWQKDFDDGLWFRYSYENMSVPLPNENQYLTWSENCGWFDCNKSFKYLGDGNMCWAAAASNMIHWWLAQNKDYIEKYDREFGPEYPDIQRPEKYSKMTSLNQQHSEVFNFFKSSFNNQGSWDTGGVNWFVNGNDKNLIYSHIPNFHGFFRKVFSKEDNVATETRNTSKENFNLWIKDAFRNNKAICFTAFDFAGPTTGRHSMTIWGAEFDASGNVAFVYFCDNNYGEDEPNHASLRRYMVEYIVSDVPEHKGEEYAYLSQLDNNDGSPKKARSQFTSITLVDLRRDVWQKAFKDNIK